LAALLAEMLIDYDELHETVEFVHPMVLAAKANSEDTPNWHQAMNGPNKEGYWKAMEKEYHTLETIMH
jgi:predicted short-subunit dehydrogenase-like oxidoreductase (DUF2520 family)